MKDGSTGVLREFEQLVRSALDELPDEFQQALQNVAIVVSDRGAEHHAQNDGQDAEGLRPAQRAKPPARLDITYL